MTGSLSQNLSPQPGLFSSSLKAAQFAQTAPAVNSNAATSATAPSATETTEPAPTVTVPTVANSSASAAALTNAAINTSLQVQTLKTANQGLNATQLSAIAPVLTLPTTTNAMDATSSNAIAPPVGTPNWEQAVGQKISWMAVGGQQSASLTLNPPDLGPLQVVLSVNNQHVSATFISHQPEVRAALESAIPKLREMMGQSGIQLGECNVSSQTKQQQEFAQRQSNSTNSINSTNSSVSTVGLTQLNQSDGGRGGIGLVDTFV
ncbi:flagellar hook-length control protein FliK [Solimicrobium silvestre]|uniref:flagellar hook-length control protein FliK n=1 Tax=Solimicrobium silvestre TaxID=2099400 RepID=UPI0013FE0DA5|nr:flagellar hook-length control protein FliK [Solimicrobium silvestre]